MDRAVKLVSIGTAVPEHVLLQRDVAAAAHDVFGPRYPGFGGMAGVFASAGIRKRHAVKPLDWFFEPRGWPERTEAFLEGAGRLFIDAASQAIEAAGIGARDIDCIVTISSTGIATPSLEARAAKAMGFRDDARRVPVFGLGCAGGVSGLSLASELARARPGTHVLMVAVEVCSLAFRLDHLTKANIVATALFGDGAAACVLRAGPDGIATVEASGEHCWSDTLDIMGWKLDGQGFGVIFSQAIPPFVEANIAGAITGILGRAGLDRPSVDRFVCHPGGIRVIQSLEHALALGQGCLDHERDVLSEYGNMSAPSVLFVLERAIEAGLPPRSALTALGPGFTASCAVLKSAA
ncbi:MAG: type III polyketide synthase [Rhizobiales bacterium]|nr:type III polyketide synthase [Hyphomicrobiales bacterium]